MGKRVDFLKNTAMGASTSDPFYVPTAGEC